MMSCPLVFEDDDRRAATKFSGTMHPHIVLVAGSALVVVRIIRVIVMFDLNRSLVRLCDILLLVTFYSTDSPFYQSN